jgi:hypothetical protein
MRAIFAILMTLSAVGLPAGLLVKFADVSGVHDYGREGTLTIIGDTGSYRSRRGGVRHYYDASLAGSSVHLQPGTSLVPGTSFPVIYDVDKLREYQIRKSGQFHAYIFGSKTDSKWSVFLRQTGEQLLWILGFIELLCIVWAYLSWRAFLTKEKA